ncbi:MAG: protein phosphatase 2C domain-containing protein [Acidimicrobiales bacterium]
MNNDSPGSPGNGESPHLSWMVFTESARGSAHDAMGLPNQDSYLRSDVEIGGAGAVVVAVADGHGNRRHFRSASGSRFAVRAACECVADASGRLESCASIADLEGVAAEVIIPAILDRWRSTVADDVASDPFSEEEESLRAEGDAPDVAYGSTLMLAVMMPSTVLCIQIGDGDIVVVERDGSALLPVPGDPSLDGHRTTSLCQTTALESFRLGTVDLSTSRPVAVMLATDGFGNSQVADPWPPAVGADLARLLEEHRPAWVGHQLSDWTIRCASEGSGDDTTVALILLADRPHDVNAGRSSRPRRRLLVSAGVIAVAAVIAAVLGVALSGGGTSKPPDKVHSRVTAHSIEVRNPITGGKISVPLPPQVGVGPYVEEGKWLFVLSDDRVWRITISEPSEVRSSGYLDSAGPPVTGTSSTITVSGFNGKVEYLVDAQSLDVKCVPKDLNGTSAGLCAASRTSTTVP